MAFDTNNIATLTTERPRFADHAGRTFVMTGIDRTRCYGGGSIWSAGLKPSIRRPTASIVAGTGKATGMFFFALCGYRRNGMVQSAPSPFAVSNGKPFIETTNSKIQLTWDDADYENADEVVIWVKEAQENIWHDVAHADVADEAWTFDLSPTELQAEPIAVAPESTPLDNAFPPAFRRAVSWLGRLYGWCGGDLTLSSGNYNQVILGSARFPRPFPDDAEGRIIRGVAAIQRTGDSNQVSYNDSEHRKILTLDSEETPYWVDHVLSTRALRLDRRYQDPGVAIEDLVFVLLEAVSDVYYSTTDTFSGTLTSGQPTITSPNKDGRRYAAGMSISDAGDTNIPAGTTILSVTETVITMSANATGNGVVDPITVDLTGSTPPRRKFYLDAPADKGLGDTEAPNPQAAGYLSHGAYVDIVDLTDGVSPEAAVVGLKACGPDESLWPSSGELVVELRSGNAGDALEYDAAGDPSNAGLAIEERPVLAYGFTIDDADDALPASPNLVGSRVILEKASGESVARTITAHDTASVTWEDGLEDYEDYTTYTINEAEYLGDCRVTWATPGATKRAQLFTGADWSGTPPSANDKISLRNVKTGAVTTYTIDSVNVANQVVVFTSTAAHLHWREYYIGEATIYSGTVKGFNDTDQSQALAWANCGLYLNSLQAGSLSAAAGRHPTRRDSLGVNPEASPPAQVVKIEELGEHEIIGAAVVNGALVEMTAYAMAISTGRETLGFPVSQMQQTYEVGLASEASLVQVTEDVGDVMAGDLIFAGARGIFWYRPGGLVNVTEELGAGTLWRRIDEATIPQSVGAWDQVNGRYSLGNVSFDGGSQVDRLVWDVKHGAILRERYSPLTASAQVVTDNDAYRLLEGTADGFLCVGGLTDEQSRESVLEADRAAGTQTYYSGTPDWQSNQLFYITAGETALPDEATQSLAGAFVVLRSSTTGAIAAKQILTQNTVSGAVLLTAPFASYADYDQYYIGGIHVDYESGVVGGRNVAEKLMQSLTITLEGPTSPGTFPSRLRVWPAGTERDPDEIDDATADSVLVTKSMVDSGEIFLGGAVSRAFQFRFDVVCLNEEWRMSLLRLAYDLIQGQF